MHFKTKLMAAIAAVALTAGTALADTTAIGTASAVVDTAAIVEGDSGTTFGGGSIGAAECSEAFTALGLGVSTTNRVCLLTKTTLGLYQAGLLSPQEARLNAIEIMRMQGIEYRTLNQPQQAAVSTRSASPAPQQAVVPQNQPSTLRVRLDNGHLNTLRSPDAIATVIEAVTAGGTVRLPNGRTIVGIVN